MKIIQLATNLNVGDAIGNEMLAIHRALTGAGYDCRIMALTIHPQLARMASAVDFSAIQPEDLVIFHKMNGDAFTERVAALDAKKVVLYHNITPGKFFLAYDSVMAWNLWRGRRQLKRLAGHVDYGWGDSEYNCRELAQAGFPRDRLSVLPILFEPDRTTVPPDGAVAARLAKAPGAKLLFIGRIAPNKRQEDVIKVYCRFLQTVDSRATLYLVGSWTGFEKYYAKLKGFAADLGLSDEQVVFTGLVSEAEKAAYLQGADAFVCMSEHEGFGVPLVEAMRVGLPVAAYASSAVPETLGDNGLLFREKCWDEIAGKLGQLCLDAGFRAGVLERQRQQLARFEGDGTRHRLLALVERAIADGGTKA